MKYDNFAYDITDNSFFFYENNESSRLKLKHKLNTFFIAKYNSLSEEKILEIAERNKNTKKYLWFIVENIFEEGDDKHDRELCVDVYSTVEEAVDIIDEMRKEGSICKIVKFETTFQELFRNRFDENFFDSVDAEFDEVFEEVFDNGWSPMHAADWLLEDGTVTTEIPEGYEVFK